MRTPSLRPVVRSLGGVPAIELLLGDTVAFAADPAAPAGVALQLPGGRPEAVRFRHLRTHDDRIVSEPLVHGNLRLVWHVRRIGDHLVERTLEATALRQARFALSFPVRIPLPGAMASFSGAVDAPTQVDTIRGAQRTETFPVGMVRTTDTVFGIAAESPGEWENRCGLLLEPAENRMTVRSGDGRAPYPLVLRPPEDARDTYQYTMDGWRTLAAGETLRCTTWCFVAPARTHHDAQLAAHIAVANAKGWNQSSVEAILRNTAWYLLRRNLARDENDRARAGSHIFVSGPGYGWKQWVSDGFWTALGLGDPRWIAEAHRAVFWNRMDYEDNCQYHLIWTALVRRSGGNPDLALARRALDFLRRNQRDGLYVPPSLPGAPNAKGWKTYHDVLPYDEGDCPTSNQGFHCAALMAARELGLPVSRAEIDRAIAGYRSLFNRSRGFFPTSRMQSDTLGQDTLYGATLCHAVYGVKLATDDQVRAHHAASRRVATPYGLRVISTADGELLPGHSGVYCYGGSWFLNDAANLMLAEVHGVPAAETDALLADRILVEIRAQAGFNESISTVDGHPHGHVLYSWNSGFLWLRRALRERLGRVGPDPVDQRVDQALGIVRRGGLLEREPAVVAGRPHARARVEVVAGAPGRQPWIGCTVLRTDMPGGRHANIRTMRARVVSRDGRVERSIGDGLADAPEGWTQFAGWSPDGAQAILGLGWQDPDNARWEEEHRTFRMDPGRWRFDNALVDLATGSVAIPTAVERVGHHNSGLHFRPDGTLGFASLVNGVSKPFVMNRDGRAKRDVSGGGNGFTYGFTASPDGRWISYHADYQVWIARADGTDRRRIETGNPFNFAPTWSPDSRHVLFLAGVRGRSNPVIASAEDRSVRPLTDLGGYQGWILFLDVDDFHEGSSDIPVWSADGRHVFHTARTGANVELFRTDLAGRTERLTSTPAGTLHYHPTPSRDGRWLAFGALRDGTRNLYVLDLSSGREQAITRFPRGRAAMWPQWQPIP
ncbi:MAG: TolB family protein [Armatimonadota bacterium]